MKQGADIVAYDTFGSGSQPTFPAFASWLRMTISAHFPRASVSVLGMVVPYAVPYSVCVWQYVADIGLPSGWGCQCYTRSGYGSTLEHLSLTVSPCALFCFREVPGFCDTPNG